MKLVLSSPGENVGPATWRPAGVFCGPGKVEWFGQFTDFLCFPEFLGFYLCNQKKKKEVKTKTKNHESKNKNETGFE